MLFAIPSASFGCINAILHQTFLFLGQVWQLFEVSQILEFLRYLIFLMSVVLISQKIASTIFFHSQTGMDGWMVDLRCFPLFNSISVMSGQWKVYNERLCANGTLFTVEMISPKARIELGPLDQ